MTKAAVIGAGAIARQHLACLRAMPAVDLAGVCDLSPVMAESAAERFGLAERGGRWFTDHHRMLDELRPDVVHVTTPPATHFALAMDALAAGSHVLVEKPITADPDELDRLCEAADRAGRHVVEDHNYLFNDTLRRVMAWLHSGELGDVTHVEAGITLNILGEGSRAMDTNPGGPGKSLLSMPGGPIGNFVTHLAAAAHAFVGPHRAVRTVWSKRRPDTPLPSDEMRALVDADRGTATLIFSAHAQPDAFWVRVLGTRMRAEAHLFEPRVTAERVHDGPGPLTPLRNGLGVAGAEFRSAFGGLKRKLAGGPGAYQGLWELLRRMYQGIAQGGPMPVSIEAMRQVNRLVADLTREANRL